MIALTEGQTPRINYLRRACVINNQCGGASGNESLGTTLFRLWSHSLRRSHVGMYLHIYPAKRADSIFSMSAAPGLDRRVLGRKKQTHHPVCMCRAVTQILIRRWLRLCCVLAHPIRCSRDQFCNNFQSAIARLINQIESGHVKEDRKAIFVEANEELAQLLMQKALPQEHLWLYWMGDILAKFYS